MSKRDDAFFDVPKTTVSTAEGDAELPIAYYDSSQYLAVFQADAAAAQRALQGTGLEPVLARRKAIVTLSFFKYRDTSIGPYHEVGLSVLAVPEGRQLALKSLTDLWQNPGAAAGSASFVLDLPVSMPVACAAGREIWGYPKFVTQMPIELDGDDFCGRVLDPEGSLIMQLSGQRGYGAGDEIPGTDLVTFSHRDGQLLRTRVRVRCRYTSSGGGSLTLEIGDSPHRMADNLRQLGLDDAQPKLFQTTEDFQSLLYAGEPV
jgi:hypothetical protein